MQETHAQYYSSTTAHGYTMSSVSSCSAPCELSREKFFGTYLHDLSCHAGLKYEIVCLRSTNSECQERLFGQAKQIALNTTNRKQNIVIPEILLRLQMKQQEGKLHSSITPRQSKVSTVAKQVPEYQGTMVPTEFIRKRKNSWQGHLEHLSNFLVLGPGIWWEAKDGAFYFKDGARDPAFRKEGPQLLHYRSSTLKEALQSKTASWKTIVNNHIPLPALQITIYNIHGEPIETRHLQTSTSNTAAQLPHLAPNVNPTCTSNTETNPVVSPSFSVNPASTDSSPTHPPVPPSASSNPTKPQTPHKYTCQL